jgi:hypothetical protein
MPECPLQDVFQLTSIFQYLSSFTAVTTKDFAPTTYVFITLLAFSCVTERLFHGIIVLIVLSISVRNVRKYL